MSSFTRATAADSFVMLVDHQSMTIDWVKSLPRDTVVQGCRVLTRLALSYDMPLILTTTMEDAVGPTIPDICDLAPQAFADRFRRGGELSCWDEARLRDAAAALGRPHVYLAGLTTDICLFWAATGALDLGYRVTVVADACGTMTPMGDAVTYDRMRGLGIAVTVANQVVTEIATNFGVPEGAAAYRIMAEEVISKL